ncbi:MAG: hypothetical protein MZV70_35705 [Desulfobacterales bacterium]|nr:hypothetical protein [Desulfobacterales bacterium]
MNGLAGALLALGPNGRAVRGMTRASAGTAFPSRFSRETIPGGCSPRLCSFPGSDTGSRQAIHPGGDLRGRGDRSQGSWSWMLATARPVRNRRGKARE